MKKYSVFMTILAAVSMIACQKEQEKEKEPVVEPEKEVVFTTISATASEAETKTYVDGLQVKWSKDDVIAVANEDDELVEFTLKGDGGVSSGSFDGDLSGKALGTYAVYPNTTNAAVAGNKASVDYKTTWAYGKSEVPMYGVNDGTGAYTFSNIGGAIQISYTNVPASAAKFVLTETHTGAAAKPITGTVVIEDLDTTPTLDLSGLDGHTVTITGVTPDGEGNALFIIPVPAGDGYIFRFELQTSGGEAIPGTQKLASNQTINANRIKRFPAIAVPATAPNVRTLTFSFSSTSASGWSDPLSEGDNTYTLSATDYTFTATSEGSGIGQKTSYLMIYSYNSLGLPVITDYRLSKVTVHTSSTASTAVQVGITSNTASHPYVDDARAVKTLSTLNADFTFDLTASYKDKRYYIYVANNKNAQITSITLTYEESSRVFTPTTLTMSSISCTSRTSSSLTFGWTAVSGATGYQISTDNGENYGSTQVGLTYTWSTLNPFTEKTIYVKAIGDGGDYLTSAAGTKTARTALAVPTVLSWDEEEKTVTWTDPNVSYATYGTDYRYVYTIDDGANRTNATTSTTAVLTITESKITKVQAICLLDLGGDETSVHSGWSSGVSCTIGGVSTDKYYSPVSSVTASKKYILVSEYKGTKYILNPVVSSNALPMVDASAIISEGKIVSNATNDAYAVTITGTTGEYAISYKDGVNTKYFSVNTGTGKNAGKNLTGVTDADSSWDITKHTDNSWIISNQYNDNSTARAIIIGNSGGSCKYYAKSNLGTSGYANTYVTLYQLED